MMTATVDAETEPSVAKRAPDTVLTYRLTPADARAWERLNPAARKRNRAGLGISLMVGISLLVTVTRHLPDWLSRLHSNAIALVILLAPFGAMMLAHRRDLARRSAERVASDVEVTLEVWPRRLVETRADGRKPLALGAEALRDVIETEGHVFLHARSGTIIVPARAFADGKAKDAFAGYWEGFAD